MNIAPFYKRYPSAQTFCYINKQTNKQTNKFFYMFGNNHLNCKLVHGNYQ